MGTLVRLAGCLLLVTGALGAPPAALAAKPERGFVSVEDDRLVLDGAPFVMKGFNYYPRDYGWTSMTDWDWSAVDRELDLAQSVGSNTLRTGINFLYATGNPDGSRDPAGAYRVTTAYLHAIDRLLELADRHGMKVILWVFDGLPGELWSPAHFAVLRKHLASFVPRYADDPRIAAWDLFTDLDASMLQRPPGGAFGALPSATKANMVTLVRNESKALRSLDANHPLAVGFSWPSSGLLVQDVTDFLLPQFLGGDHPELLAKSRIGEAEGYLDATVALGNRAAALAGIQAKIAELQRGLRRPMPIVLSEFGLPSGAPGTSPEKQAAVDDVVCDLAFVHPGLAGALAWELTEYRWPPKAMTNAELRGPLASAAERSFGTWDLRYRPKPAVEVVRRYFRPAPTIAVQTEREEIELALSATFRPSDRDPASTDDRVLSVALDAIELRAADGSVLDRVDVGLAADRRHLVSGFSGDEGPWAGDADTFAWVEGREAVVRVPFPEGTTAIALRAFNLLGDQQMTISVDGRSVGQERLGADWRTYEIVLPSQSIVAGEPTPVRARLDIPLSDGAATIEAGSDALGWQVLATVRPTDGVVDAPVAFPAAGTVLVRARWSGSDRYGAATSEPVTLQVGPGATPASATPTPTPAATSSTTGTAPPPTAGPGASPGPTPTGRPAGDGFPVLIVLAGVLVAVGGGVAFAVRRRGRRP